MPAHDVSSILQYKMFLYILLYSVDSSGDGELRPTIADSPCGRPEKELCKCMCNILKNILFQTEL